MHRRFALLLLVLAKRRVAIHWMGKNGPQIQKWKEDVAEWAVAEETRLRKCRKDVKREEDLGVWRQISNKFVHQGSYEGEASTEIEAESDSEI